MVRRSAFLFACLALASNGLPALAEGSSTPSDAVPEGPSDTLQAAEQEEETESLAASSQNPIADLISVPFQNNTTFGVDRPGLFDLSNGGREDVIDFDAEQLQRIRESIDLSLVTHRSCGEQAQGAAGSDGSSALVASR